MKIKCFNIVWDIDDCDCSMNPEVKNQEDLGLPSEVILEFDDLFIHAIRYDDEELEEELVEELTSKTGFCVKSYEYEKLT